MYITYAICVNFNTCNIKYITQLFIIQVKFLINYKLLVVKLLGSQNLYGVLTAQGSMATTFVLLKCQLYIHIRKVLRI